MMRHSLSPNSITPMRREPGFSFARTSLAVILMICLAAVVVAV